MALGSGTERVRIKHQVPQFGEIVPPLDIDELDALALPPGHSLYPTVTIEGAKLQSDITNTKCRWDRHTNRDFDNNGNEVTPTEDLEPKPIDDILEENQHRESYNHQTKTSDK